MSEDNKNRIKNGISDQNLLLQKPSVSSASLVLSLSPILAFTAIAYESIKQPSLSLLTGMLEPVVFILCISYAALKTGRKTGLLAALIASLYIISVREALPYELDQFAVRISLSILFVSAALIFTHRKTALGAIPRTSATIPKEETGTPSPYIQPAGSSATDINLSTFESIPLGVLAFYTHEHRIIFVNQQVKDIVGNFKEIEELRPLNFFNKKGESVAFEELPIFKALENGLQNNFEEFSIETEEESVFFRIAASPLFDGSGKIKGVLAIMEKIPGTHALLARQEDFMDIARAELGPQLSRLDRYMTLLRLHMEKISDEHAVIILKRMEIQFRRLDHAMQRLLQFARIDFEEMPFKIETFDIIKLLTETIDAMQQRSPDHQIIFLPQTHSFALGDRFRMRKVVDHLLKNAIKYSPLGGKIIVSLVDENGMHSVSIRDFGEGIEENKLTRMEKALSITESSERREGLGIGLYTSNEIVRRLGGEIGVQSKRGKGTEFFFTVPMVLKEDREKLGPADSETSL